MNSNPDDTVLSAKSLHYFLDLIENMSYTQTANNLGITQPALTQQIKKLEHTVGAPLFIQVGKKLILTPAGKELERTAHKLFSTVNEAIDNIQQYTSPESGHISIGVLGVIETRVLDNFLIHYHKLYPEVTISTQLLNRNELWHKLDNNEIDIALTYLPDENLSKETMRSYEVKKIYTDSLVFLSHGDSSQTSKQLTDKKWAAYTKDVYFQQVMEQYYKLHELNHAPEVVARFSVSYQLIHFTQAFKEYNTVVPNSFYQAHRAMIKLQPVDINPIIYFDTCFVTRKSKQNIPRLQQFFEKWNEFLDKKDYASRLNNVESLDY